jgi:uncharacterized protein
VILVDTNVLIYAAASDHELRDPCRALVDALGDEVVDATTTTEVVQQYVHVRSRRVERSTAVREAQHLGVLLHPLSSSSEADLLAGLELFVEHAALGCFDAVLAATALRLGATLVSADRAFAGIERLVHLHPGAPTFLADLGIGSRDEAPAG